ADPRPVDLAAVAREVAEAVAPRLEAAGVRLQLEADDPLPRPSGDAFLLRQALENLVDNAIAFSPRGATVDVALRARGEAVELAVADAGPGAPGYALGQGCERCPSPPPPRGGGRTTGSGRSSVAEPARRPGGRTGPPTRQP